MQETIAEIINDPVEKTIAEIINDPVKFNNFMENPDLNDPSEDHLEELWEFAKEGLLSSQNQ